MRNKKIFVLKIVWRRSIASLHRLTQAVQRANLRRTAGDPTWVCFYSALSVIKTFDNCVIPKAFARIYKDIWIIDSWADVWAVSMSGF